MSTNAKKFMELFDGLRRAYGTFEAKSSRERDGKKTGRVISHQKDITEDVWIAHLKGVQSVGVTPIRDDSTCVFGAIDVDSYDGLDLGAMAVKIDKMRLPLVPCRSKSGGLHAWIFLSEPAPAESVQRKLREMAAALGYGRSEIFPKQTEVLPDRGDIGSWINMPYFGGLSGGRYGVRPDGSPMSEEEFLSTASIKQITLEELEGVSAKVKEELADGPPCLQHLVAQGFPAGTRNSGLYNLGVYCKKASPDNWEQLVEQYNIKVMQPPLGTNEVKELLKSLKKKDYQYTCQQVPLSSYCNSNVCRGKKYGIGDHAGMPTVTGLTKFNSQPPIWFADIEGGGRLELTTDDLQSQHRFQRCCMESLNSMPPPMNAKAWQVMIQNLLENVEVIEAPQDATPRGQLLEMIEKFCTQRAQALVKEEIRLGKPFTELNKHYFTVAGLTSFLERHKFKDFKLNEITSFLKNDLRADHHFANFRGRGLNFWSVEEFTKSEGEMPVPEGWKNGGPF